MRFFSPAQVVGYAAFFFGVISFLQKTDRRLKAFNATQSLVYALHFVLLGNLPASAVSLVSSVRSYLALKFRSLVLAGAIIAVYLVAGKLLARNAAGWLPVIASCAATVAMFTMKGLALRSVLLCCTVMWLANNVLSGSIGGTMLETSVAAINLTTMLRLSRSQDAPVAGDGG